MNVIVTAGGETDSKQPLYQVTHGGRKAMIEIAGKSMVQWVLDALGETSQVEKIVVVGLPPETDLTCTHPLILLPDHGELLSNIMAGVKEVMRLDSQASHVLLVSGDLPALRGEMIDWFLEQVKDLDQDIYYTIIKRETMEAQFPASKRTYIHLKDLQVCGGDLHCFRLAAATEESPIWKGLIESRKNPLRQASIVGYDTLLFLMLRQLSLQDAEKAVAKRLEIKGKAVPSPYAEMGMDVDKPFQLEIIREYLSRRQEKHAAEAEQA